MTDDYDVSGQIVLVTGAAQGIGQRIVQRFFDAGARVIAVDQNEATLMQAWGHAGPDRVRAATLDVRDSKACEALVRDCEASAGPIGVLVNNAGITRDAVVWKMSDDAWRDVLDVHLTGTFNLTRAVIPGMRSRSFGRIVNVTSYSGLHGNIGQSNYAAAKAGIVGFTKAVAKEVARFGITVNALSPNAETPMVAAIPPDRFAALAAAIPMGRFGRPDEMTGAVQFLASQAAAYVTGAVLPVDGGMAM